MAGSKANGAKAAGEENSLSMEPANGSTLNAAQRKKLKKKQREKAKKAAKASSRSETPASSDQATTASTDQVVVEYVSAPRAFEDLLADEEEEDTRPGLGGAGLGAADDGDEAKKAAVLEDLKRIYERFASAEEVTGATVRDQENGADEDALDPAGGAQGAAAKDEAGSDDDSENEGDDEARMSKKRLRMARQLKVAELKKECERPEVVEVWDVTATDPKLLVYLKAYRNSVPVPRHWSQKRHYLQGKRGLEKPAFKLPEYIEATGIGQMRQAYHAKEDDKKLKQRMRDRMQPKMGKLDIDYSILHDAFFKHQKPPPMTGWGELYYEGKEFEPNYKNRKPGFHSSELQEALGMTPGHPPPWLINMQRYGPPPSYPDLKIPGLNAPIPPGAQFGYQPGGWGKPPVDEHGTPLYGNVFGAWDDDAESEDEVDKHAHFGDLASDVASSSEEEESEEESEQEQEGGEEDMAAGMASVASGISSIPSGLDTPEVVDLRKRQGITTPSVPAVLPPGQLYTVLEQKQVNVGSGIMGTDHVYVVPGAEGSKERPRAVGAAAQKRLEALRQGMPTDVDVAISPEELETLDDAALQQLYEARAREAGGAREDFSDLVAQQAASQKRKAASKLDKQEKKFKF